MNERIRKVRQELGLTQKEFSEMLNVNRSTVAIWENDIERKPGKLIVSHICDKFDVNPEWLETGEGDMFKAIDREKQLTDFLAGVLRVNESSSDEDKLKRELIAIMAKLSPEAWVKLTEVAKEIRGTKKEQGD